MRKMVLCFWAVLAAVLWTAESYAFATSVFIQPDGTYCSYRKNDEVDVISVKESKLRGRTIPKGEAFIPKGTSLEIVLPHHLHSRHMEAGDMITFKLKEPLLVNDVVVAPAGTNVWAEVLYSVGSWSWGHGGEMDMLLKGFKTYNGVVVPLNLRVQKKNSDMNDLAVALGYGIVGGAVFHGSSVRVHKEEPWIVQVSENVDLNISLADLAEHGIYHGLSVEEMETDPSLMENIRVPKEFSSEYTKKYGYKPSFSSLYW